MAVAVTGSLAGLLDDGPYPFWVAAAVAVTAVVSLALDSFRGLLVGLAMAAAVIGLKRAGGAWATPQFWPALAQTVALLASGLAAGAAGTRLRDRPDRAAPVATAGDAVYGSLGLVDRDVALARLEDEVERALRHRRPLSLLRVDVEVNDARGRDAALRAVARLVETRVRDTDVPFAFSPESFGVILPETNGLAAWEVVGPVVDAAHHATYTVRDGGTSQRRLADAIQLHVGLATLGVHGTSADELLDAATEALRRAQAGAS